MLVFVYPLIGLSSQHYRNVFEQEAKRYMLHQGREIEARLGCIVSRKPLRDVAQEMERYNALFNK